ncbi:MAG: hypothetical protein ABIH66_01505 [bacterium]
MSKKMQARHLPFSVKKKDAREVVEKVPGFVILRSKAVKNPQKTFASEIPHFV